jgi:hypothetical protein
MQTKWDFAGSTDMWSTSAGGHLMKVVNLTGFTVYCMRYLFLFSRMASSLMKGSMDHSVPDV